MQQQTIPQIIIKNGCLGRVIYFFSVLAVFLIVHLTTDKINRLARKALRTSISDRSAFTVETIQAYSSTIKAIIFVFALLVLCWPILKNIYLGFTKSAQISRIGRAFLIAIVASIAVALFAFRPGTDSMGTNYAIIALNPFAQHTSIHSTRLLMPALAYLLFLRDFQPYYLFSAFLTVTLIALLYLWAEDHAPIKTWQLVSLCTSSFVIFQYQYGGYPDIFVFVFFILFMQKNVNQDTRLSLLILALLAHESSIFIGVVLAFRYLDHKHLIAYLTLALIYGIIWLGVSDWNIKNIVGGHSVGGRSGMEWLIESSKQEILGILVSYKALWLTVPVAIWITIRQRLYPDALFILACIGAGIFMTVLGVDTSRLMGFAFPGILVTIAIVNKQPTFKNFNKYALPIVFAINLIIPSFYIGLNGWIEFFPGIYNLLYGWIAAV